jgi:hypothetical protein
MKCRFAAILILSWLTIPCPDRAVADQTARPLRRVVSLDGAWQIAEGSKDRVPQTFDRQVPVSGLADMATPPFAEIGTEVYPAEYAVEVSPDGKAWKTVFSSQAGKGGREVIRFLPVEARWVRVHGTKRGSPSGGYSLFEFQVFH